MHLTQSEWKYLDARASHFTGRSWVFTRVRSFLAGSQRMLGQSFNRQNVHVHYRKHMQVLDLAVAEEAARRGISPMLDIERASEIHAQHERNRARLRSQVDALIQEGLPWKTRDVLAFMEQDVRLEEQRNQLRAEIVMIQARAFGDAVRKIVVDDNTHAQILAAYDEIIARRLPAETEDFIYHDEDLAGDPEEA